MLKEKCADVVVTPRDEGEVVRVAAACAKHRIPLTVRAGGTGNYGQCTPLEGGEITQKMPHDGLFLVGAPAGGVRRDVAARRRPQRVLGR